MFNPWLTKNPLMSMWLSTANRMVGTIRGQAAAQAKREVKTAVAEATKETVKRASTARRAPAARKKATRKR